MASVMAADDFTQRIREMYRIVLGATIGFLPFVMFFLLREVQVELFTAAILWLLTTSVIISEWWSIEDNTSNYPINYAPLNSLSMVYLIVLTILPVSLIVGLDKFNNLQPYILIFIALSILDIPLSIIYCIKVDKSERKYFAGTVVFDIVLIGLYYVLMTYVMPEHSNTWNAIMLTIAYLIEFTLDWWVVPFLTTKIADGLDETNDADE